MPSEPVRSTDYSCLVSEPIPYHERFGKTESPDTIDTQSLANELERLAKSIPADIAKRDANIIALREAGFSLYDISAVSGLAISTVSRLIKAKADA